MPLGGSIAMSVCIVPVPPCGWMVTLETDALDRSKPTDVGVDSVGVVAFSLSNLMRTGFVLSESTSLL